jgi:hypothetical protein
MAEMEVDIVCRVDGHVFVFRGVASRGPSGNRQDTGRTFRIAVDRAMEQGENCGKAVMDRYSMPDVVPPALESRGPTGTHVRPRPVRDAPQA